MSTDHKRKAKQTDIKVVVKNRPPKEEAELKLKQLGELLSNNWQSNNPPD